MNKYIASKIVVLIPAYNPDSRLVSLARNLQDEGLSLVVVDDGSKEDCTSVFHKLSLMGVCIVTHAVNMGKGRALKSGFNFTLLNFSDRLTIITADADGQHTAEDIFSVAECSLNNTKSLVLGVRNFTEKGENIPIKNRLGNIITGGIFSFLSGVKVGDTQTGLRGIPMKYAALLLNVEGERFQYEMHMLLEAERFGFSIEQVPIATIYIDENRSSHFNPLVDSFKIYFVFLTFISVSVLSALVDYGIFSLIYYLTAKNLLAFSVARIVSTVANFYANKAVVFKNDIKTRRSLMKYYSLVIVIAVLSYLIMIGMTGLGLNIYIAKPSADIILFFLSYYVQKHFVFKSDKKVHQ